MSLPEMNEEALGSGSYHLFSLSLHPPLGPWGCFGRFNSDCNGLQGRCSRNDIGRLLIAAHTSLPPVYYRS